MKEPDKPGVDRGADDEGVEELDQCEVHPEYILVFGPGNEMVIHGN
jgi:hypothetical protein